MDTTCQSTSLRLAHFFSLSQHKNFKSTDVMASVHFFSVYKPAAVGVCPAYPRQPEKKKKDAIRLLHSWI
jgi:hypothetical protein